MSKKFIKIALAILLAGSAVIYIITVNMSILFKAVLLLFILFILKTVLSSNFTPDKLIKLVLFFFVGLMMFFIIIKGEPLAVILLGLVLFAIVLGLLLSIPAERNRKVDIFFRILSSFFVFSAACSAFFILYSNSFEYGTKPFLSSPMIFSIVVLLFFVYAVLKLSPKVYLISAIIISGFYFYAAFAIGIATAL
jgi:hypothetical protein